MSIYGSSRKITVVIVIIALVLMIGAGEYAYPLERSPKGSEQIAVTELWFDGVDAPAGQVYYLLDVNASNSGVHDWLFDPSHLSLTSNTSDVYAPDPGYNETAILGASSIDPGRQILGEVAFGLPTGQSPSKLSYVDNAAGIFEPLSLARATIPRLRSGHSLLLFDLTSRNSLCRLSQSDSLEVGNFLERLL